MVYRPAANKGTRTSALSKQSTYEPDDVIRPAGNLPITKLLSRHESRSCRHPQGESTVRFGPTLTALLPGESGVAQFSNIRPAAVGTSVMPLDQERLVFVRAHHSEPVG